MHDLEYAVGIGCWLALAYFAAVYNFGNITPFLVTVTPIITICLAYIVIILLDVVVYILFRILKSMFSPEVILFLMGIFLLLIFTHVVKGAIDIAHTVPLEVE